MIPDLSLTIQHCIQFQTISYSIRNRRKKDSKQGNNFHKRKAENANEERESKLSKYEKPREQCQVCKGSFVSLMKHLSKAKGCKDFYSDEELQNLLLASKLKKAEYQKKYQKDYQKEYQKNNAEKLKNYQKNYQNIYYKEKVKPENYKRNIYHGKKVPFTFLLTQWYLVNHDDCRNLDELHLQYIAILN